MMVIRRIEGLLIYSGMFLYWSGSHAIPNFHLKNKSNEAIQVNVTQNNSSVTQEIKTIGKDRSLALDLAINKSTTIELYFCPTATWCKTKLPRKLTAQCAPGQTLYIKFNGSKLEPQKGDLFGNTTEGYDLSNNIQSIKQSIADSTIQYPEGQKPTAKPQPIPATKTTTAKTTTTQSNMNRPEQLRQTVAPTNQPQTKPASQTASKSQQLLITQASQSPQESLPTAVGKVATGYGSLDVYSDQVPVQTMAPEMVGKASNGYTPQPVTQPYAPTLSAQMVGKTASDYRPQPVTQVPVQTMAPEMIGKTANGYTPQPVTQPYAPTLSPAMVGKTGPVISDIPLQTQGAARIAPTAPLSKKAAADVATIAYKAPLREEHNESKLSPAETETTKPDSKELAWQEFPEANQLRKKLKNGDQSPFVARKVLELTVGATESDIKKSAQKRISFYQSRSYTGDVSLVPELIAIISNAKTILIDAIYPPLSAQTISPIAQELQTLLYQAPTGYEDFAAPLYQDLVARKQYSRDFLQDIQKQVMAHKGVPEKWRQAVLSKIQRLLSQAK
jgi:hypothetical protein